METPVGVQELEEGECVESNELQVPPLPEVAFNQFICFAPKTRIQLLGKWLNIRTKTAVQLSGFLYALDPDKNDIYLLSSDGKKVSVIFAQQIETVQANLSKQWTPEKK